MDNEPSLVTPRTRIVLFTELRAPLVQRYHEENRDHLSRWEPRRGKDFYELEHWRRRGAISEAEFQSRVAIKLLALDPSRKRMLAGCNFTNIVFGPLRAGNLGYSVAKTEEGSGIMHEVLERALEYVFVGVGLHRVMANYQPHNERSGRLLKRLGFEREGIAKAYMKIDGAWRDHILTAKVNPAHTASDRWSP